MRVAGADGQRTARVDATEALARGERLRIGYQSGGHRYLLSLSIDDRGEVTPLYPERGRSLRVPRRRASATRFLPDSLELTGKGTERIIVVLSDQPIDVEAARAPRAPPTSARAATSRACPSWTCPANSSSRTFAQALRTTVRASQLAARARARCCLLARRRPPRARRRCGGSRSSRATTTGGGDTRPLLYASADARKVHDILTRLGGVRAEDATLLLGASASQTA